MSSIQDTELLGQEFCEVVDDMKADVLGNLERQSVQKGAKYFMKTMRKCVNRNIEKLVQTLFSVGRQGAAPLRSGQRRNSKTIPVQPTSVSRRVAKHRGRGKAPSGRKPRDQRQRTQFVINDDTDDCNVARALPAQKKSRSRRLHSLSFNVRNNLAPPLT